MNKNRFFNLVVIVALAVMAALTINQVAAANRLVSGESNLRTSYSCSAPGAVHSPIRTEYEAGRGGWVISTDDGPTGVDGGLIQLLNDRRACSN